MIWCTFLRQLPHTPSSNHLDDGYTPPMPSPVSGRHTSMCLQILSTFISKRFLKCTKLSHLPSSMNTLTPPSPPPPPPLFLLTSTSLDSRFSDQEPHRTSGFLQHHHPPCSAPISNALTSGSTAYSVTPPSTPTCFVYRMQFKTIPRSLQHPTDRSLLPSEHTAGSAPYLMASALLPAMDPFSAVRHPPSVQKHMVSSPTSASYTALASTLTPLYPWTLSSTLTLPV